MAEVSAAHRSAYVVDGDQVRIEFPGLSVFVEATISFPIALVCIERVGPVPAPPHEGH
jgi:hypothetical protein